MNILWIPHTGWHIPQRAHLFCRALAERHTVHVTDWVADFTRPADVFSARYLRNFFYRRYRDGKITVHGIPRVAPALFSPLLRRLNARTFTKLTARLLAQHRIDVVVGTFVCPPPRAPRLIFDWFDDNPAYWRDHGHNPAYADEIEATEKSYLQQANAVVAVSSVLQEQAIMHRSHKASPEVHLIPNGIDLQRYRQASRENMRAQLQLENKKVIGFISALGKFSGLARLLEGFTLLHNPDVCLLVVGKGELSSYGQRWVREKKAGNVIFAGRVPFAEIHNYYAALDIGIIPFDKTRFTDAASPIKLFEYSAFGMPVVCTPLEEVRRMDFPNVILVQDNPRALAEGMERALTMPRRVPPQIEAYDIHRLAARYEAVLRGEEPPRPPRSFAGSDLPASSRSSLPAPSTASDSGAGFP